MSIRGIVVSFVFPMMFCGFIGCTGNDENEVRYTEVNKIVVEIDPPHYYGDNDEEDADFGENVTRLSTANSGLVFTYYFEHGDTLGIFPEGGYQIPFELPIAAGQKQTSTPIEAKGWMTKAEVYYVAYLPFDFYNRYYSKIPWDYRGQVLSANGNRDNLAKYIFMASDTCTVESTVFHTVLRSKGTVVKIQCSNWPVGAGGKYKKMILASSKSGQFVTHGYFDLFDVKKETDANGNEVHADGSQPLRPADDGLSDYVSLKLADVQINEGKAFQPWMMINPTDVTNETLTIYCWREDGLCVTGDTQITNATAGNMKENAAYQINFTNMRITTTPAVYIQEYNEVVGLNGVGLE